VKRIVTAASALLVAIALPAGASAHAVPRHGHGRGHARKHAVHVRRHDARRHAHRRGHRSHDAKPRRHLTHARGAAAGDCTNTTVTPEAGNLEIVREATLCLVNRERVTRGERPLRLDGKLVQTAQGHSESMADEGYFAHESPDGSTPLDRMRAAGYIDSQRVGYEVGENIAWGTLWLASPKAIVEAWMASPGHRANILDPHYVDTGLGVVPRVPGGLGEGQAGAMYTQDFGVIISA
jgi:uncharacterized protein YkwD